MGKSTTRTFSLPDWMAREVKRFSGKTNWSAVVQDAINRELSRLRTEEAMARLRDGGEPQSEVETARDQGENLGGKWALEIADFRRLSEVVGWAKEPPANRDGVSLLEELLQEVAYRPGEQSSIEVAREMIAWSPCAGSQDLPAFSQRHWEGFLDGVRQVLETIEFHDIP